jgi:hypothetical protein
MLAPTSTPRPLALSDSQITAIMGMCRPLEPYLRDAFLQHVAAALAREPELGDGVVARVCREIFKQHWRAPELDTHGNHHVGKYAR